MDGRHGPRRRHSRQSESFSNNNGRAKKRCTTPTQRRPKIRGTTVTLPSQPAPGGARDSAEAWPSRPKNPTGVRSVSVIIAAYTEDRWHDTVEAVTSVVCQSSPPLEVILVIDHNPRLAQRARGALEG